VTHCVIEIISVIMKPLKQVCMGHDGKSTTITFSLTSSKSLSSPRYEGHNGTWNICRWNIYKYPCTSTCALRFVNFVLIKVPRRHAAPLMTVNFHRSRRENSSHRPSKTRPWAGLYGKVRKQCRQRQHPTRRAGWTSIFCVRALQSDSKARKANARVSWSF